MSSAFFCLAVVSVGDWGVWQTLREPILWQQTITQAGPLILAAVGGTISERSGVVNIAMEGMMLVGAFFSAFTADKMASLFGAPAPLAAVLGVVGAIVAGSLIAWAHGWASIRFRANQIVSGMAINLVALGLTSYLYFTIYGTNGVPSNLAGIPNSNLPGLANIKFLSLGFIFFQQNVIIYAAFLTVILGHLFLFRTRIGLRIRSVGEHPRAADTAGINVQRLRYTSVILSGALSGLAGAYLALSGLHGTFSENMTSGRGFIALAAMIVGKWTPFGAMGACLVFGFGLSLDNTLSSSATGTGLVIGSYQVSSTLLAMLPYLLTIAAVVGLIGQSTPPAADGVPYDPTEPA